jgi:hypothetical protein
MTIGRRTRAWILIQVDSPHEAAQRIWDTIGSEVDDYQIVVRADVVKNEWFNLVVPVDVADPNALESINQRIVDLITPARTTILPVSQHFPLVPHDAEGFITGDEYDMGHDKLHCKVGRQRWSPGLNAWG